MTIERSEIDLQNATEMRPEQKPEKYTKFERAILSEIANYDAARPVTLKDLCWFLNAPDNLRKVKGTVRRLRNAGEPIGAHRGKPRNGYYWATSAEDLEMAARPMLNQAFAMLRTARKLLGARRLREMAGQATIDEMFGAAE